VFYILPQGDVLAPEHLLQAACLLDRIGDTESLIGVTQVSLLHDISPSTLGDQEVSISTTTPGKALQGYCPVVPQAGDVRKPARGTIEVKLIKSQSAYDLLANPDVQKQLRTQTLQGNKGLIVVNTVSRAVHMYKKLFDEGWSSAELLLLHSRFLASDRRELEKRVLDRQFSLLIATQAVEAGLDIPGVTRAVMARRI